MALRRKRLRFVHATPRARSHGGWWPDTLASKGEPARDGDGSEAVGGRAVAERALAPAIGGPTGRHTARVVVARGHSGEGEPARDRNWGGAVRGRAVAELAVRIVAPTVVGPAGGHAAHGSVARGAHRGEGEPARDRDWGGAVRGRAVAELAVIIRAPTVGGPAGRHAARREVARAHGSEGEPARDRDRREAARVTPWRESPIPDARLGSSDRTVAELALLVDAPTVGGPGGRHAARGTEARPEPEALGRDGRSDVEAAASGSGQGRGRRSEGVAGSEVVDAHVREGGDAIDRGDCRRAGEGPTRGVDSDRQRDAGGGRRHGVALGILDRHLHGGRARRASNGVAGLHDEGELRRCSNTGGLHRPAARASRERDTTEHDPYPERAMRRDSSVVRLMGTALILLGHGRTLPDGS